MNANLTKIDKGTLLLALCAVVSSLFVMAQEARKYYLAPAVDEVAQFESKLKFIESKLPPQARISYVSDLSDNKADIEHSGDLDYYRTLYALSPRMVTRNEPGQFFIGIYPEDALLLSGLPIIYQDRIDNKKIVLYKRSSE